MILEKIREEVLRLTEHSYDPKYLVCDLVTYNNFALSVKAKTGGKPIDELQINDSTLKIIVIPLSIQVYRIVCDTKTEFLFQNHLKQTREK